MFCAAPHRRHTRGHRREAPPDIAGGKLQGAGPEVTAVAERLRVLGEETGLPVVSVSASLRLCDPLGAVVLLYPAYRTLEFPLERLLQAGRDTDAGKVRDALQQIAGSSRPVAEKSPNIGCSQALSHWEAVTEIVRTLARLRADSVPAGASDSVSPGAITEVSNGQQRDQDLPQR